MKSIKEDDEWIKNIKKEIGLSFSQLDSLSSYLTAIDEGSFVIYKDGSILINRDIGPDLFDTQRYQIVRVGEKMFLHGNYWNTSLGNIYIGKKN